MSSAVTLNGRAVSVISIISKDNTRDIVLKGGLIIVGIFLVLRTFEKILYNGWLKGFNLKGSVQKDGIKLEGEIKAPKSE